LRNNATVTHIGNMYGTLCGQVLAGPYEVTPDRPEGRPLCATCGAGSSRARTAARSEAQITVETVTIHEAMHKAARAAVERDRDNLTVSLLREGLENQGVARQMGVALRTAVRYINDAQRRAGARTRFQWGFRCGFAAGRASRTP
jgi:hypothetical protein